MYITSICSGSIILGAAGLGAAGLLKGYKATSHWGAKASLPLFGADLRTAAWSLIETA